MNDEDFKLYDAPFKISEATSLKVYSEKNKIKSATVETKFYKIDPNLSITLETEYANQYNGGGNDALIDGILGTQDFRTGTWQGYHNTDLIATIDLGKETHVNLVTINFLEDQRSWIFYPTEVTCFGSNDGKTFTPIDSPRASENISPNENVEIKQFHFKQVPKKYRYIKIKAKTLGELPEWHLGHEHDGRSWLFADEITIK